MKTVKDWWLGFIYANGTRRKYFVSLIMLTSWAILNERNARVFHNVSTLPSTTVSIINGETALWSMAGAKHMGSIMPRE
jgi:hypothetical protein